MSGLFKKISAGLLLLSVLMAEQVTASVTIVEPMSEVIPRIHCVLRIKVTELVHGEKFMVLRDGSVGPMTAKQVTVSGSVLASVWGPCTAQKIRSEYTEIVPIFYDETGKEVLHYSPKSLGSGQEFNLKPGEEYLLSYFGPLSAGKADEIPLQHHFRVDPASYENTLIQQLQSVKP